MWQLGASDCAAWTETTGMDGGFRTGLISLMYDAYQAQQLLTPIKELGLEWKCDGEASWWKNYWFRNQLFCAWHIILGNHRCCQTSRNLFPGCCCCLHWGDKHLLHSSNSLNSARICFKQCGVTLCFIRKHHCNPGIQSPALEISNSAPVKCGESSARVVIEMLWEEQPSTGRGKNSTSGTAGSSFLEKLQPSSEPVHFRATWTQMHMFCHAWVAVTGRCMLVTLHVGKRESIQTQQIRRTLIFFGLLGRTNARFPFLRHYLTSAHFHRADQREGCTFQWIVTPLFATLSQTGPPFCMQT